MHSLENLLKNNSTHHFLEDEYKIRRCKIGDEYSQWLTSGRFRLRRFASLLSHRLFDFVHVSSSQHSLLPLGSDCWTLLAPKCKEMRYHWQFWTETGTPSKTSTTYLLLFQCDDNGCYCVDIMTGDEQPGTRRDSGKPNCNGNFSVNVS